MNLAARVQSLAGPGELCVSEAVFERSRVARDASAGAVIEARVRGIDEPVRVHRIPAS